MNNIQPKNLEDNIENKRAHTDESLESALDESVEAAVALSIRANDLVDRLMQRLHTKVSNAEPAPQSPQAKMKMFNPDAGP